MSNMKFLVNDDNHVIARISQQDMDSAIKQVKKSTGLSTKVAKQYWLASVVQFAQKTYNAKGKVDLQIVA